MTIADFLNNSQGASAKKCKQKLTVDDIGAWRTKKSKQKLTLDIDTSAIGSLRVTTTQLRQVGGDLIIRGSSLMFLSLTRLFGGNLKTVV